jgi:cytochrome c
MKKLLLLVIFSISLFASSGQKLFEEKCMTCHSKTPPSSKQERMDLVAPPIGNVLYHLDQEFKTPEEIKKHIVEFTLNPSKEKAICNSVKRFGVMPSQKENVTKEELSAIADFLTNIIVYSKNSHAKGKRSCDGKSCSTKSQAKSCNSKHQH